MGRKKTVTIDDDEYSLPQDDIVPAVEAEKVNLATSKKNKNGGSQRDHFPDDDKDAAVDGDDEPEPIVFSGKKKSSKSKKGGGGGGSGGGFSAFNALNSIEGDEEDSDEPLKSKVDLPNDEVDVDDEIQGMFKNTDKKKKKKSKGGKDVEDVDEITEKLADQSMESREVNEAVQPPEQDGEADEYEGLFKKTDRKKKKKNKSSKTEKDDEDFVDELSQFVESKPLPPPQPSPANSDAAAEQVGEADAAEDLDASKKDKKKKKKKGAKNEKDDDLDKILAELEAPPASAASAPPPAANEGGNEQASEQAEVEEKEGEGSVAESAAAKKKKKKKEKEKEKKAALVKKEETEEKEKEEEVKPPPKAGDGKKGKPLPKHVLAMQEALAKRKEAEDRKKREEEERTRKEEEERRRKEEEERLAEEKKRLKKEREKEKMLKKKQEGKLLTAKQKEEAKRLELMRKQFLAQSEASIVVDTGAQASTSKKKPIYTTKKSKPAQPKSGEHEKVEEQTPKEDENEQHEEDSMEDEESPPSNVDEVEDKVEEDKNDAEGVDDDDADDDDDEWDAKSWDDVDVTLPDKNAFAEEEAEEVDDKPLVKKAPTVDPQVHTAATSKPAEKKTRYEMKENGTKKTEVESKESGAEEDSKSDLRSPICCILGHVDTGKTKLLDCIRRTNVQEGEAGGITQQIGATYFPTENIRERTKELKADATFKVPGLLVIDTPGHESFSNLRSRGSSLCDMAILVVDIMHGLEPQTIESLNLLVSKETKFIVALNKVDRLYGWKTYPNAPFLKTFKLQSKDVQNEFESRVSQIRTQFMEKGVNTALYYKQRKIDMEETYSIVPTSALSGEGIPDLLLLLIQGAQKSMEDRLTYIDTVQCTVLEVKVVEGLGTTIDVVLVNGILREGDQIVISGMQGPIVTSIRALLTPHPMRELRVKGAFLHHKEIKAAQGVKISAQGLEHAIAGSALYVVGPDTDLEEIKQNAIRDIDNVLNKIDKKPEGVYVQASTLGSLEALVAFLKTPAVNIPIAECNIGPVHKKDVMKASVMVEKNKEYACILAFDVKVMPDAQQLAEEYGVKIFVADIIYHLFDQFKAYIDNLKEEKKKSAADEAVFPCVMKIKPNCCFNKKDPIVLGVDILEGLAKIGTPICIPSRDFIDIGKVASMEINHKTVDVASKGQTVAIKIVGTNPDEQQKSFGRHFDYNDELVSHISRNSIDVLKENYKDEMTIENWKLLVRLKTLFGIK